MGSTILRNAVQGQMCYYGGQYRKETILHIGGKRLT